jgi:hypothetical protein
MDSKAAAQLLGMCARGTTVCLPVVGAVLVVHVALEDFRRMQVQAATGNGMGSLAFGAAFACDVLYFSTHVVAFTALLHTHLGIPIVLPHEILHVAEDSELSVATVSAMAAVAGEALAGME